MALSADRNTPRRTGQVFSVPVKGATKIYAGALVCLDSAGRAVPGSVATTLTAWGRAEGRADNTSGADGAINVDVRPGIYRFANSASGDLIAQANVGANCYVVDDQTVALTSGSSTRSIAGKIVDVDTLGVWVQVGVAGFDG